MASSESSPAISLSSDCWRHVLDHLETKDFCQLARVSKDFDDLVEPLIYREVSWDWQKTSIRRALLLMRAVFRRPERALYIQHINWAAPPCHTTRDAANTFSWENRNQAVLDTGKYVDVAQHARKIVDAAKFPSAERWKSTMSWSGHQLAAVFISQLHNLRTLRLDYLFVTVGGFTGLMLNHALFTAPEGQLSKFKHLTHVEYGSNVRAAPEVDQEDDHPDFADDNDHMYSVPQFKPWLYLPALKSLHMWPRMTLDILKPDANSTIDQIHTLVLARAPIPEVRLLRLLSQATSLRRLHLGLSYNKYEEVALENGHAIFADLRIHKQTLTTFSLDWEYWPAIYSMNHSHKEEEIDIFRSLRGFLTSFKNLQTVELPARLLLGWYAQPSYFDLEKVLPTSIQVVCLRIDFAGVKYSGWIEEILLDCIQNSIEGISSRLPHLSRIIIRVEWGFKSDLRVQKRRKVRAKCAREGVRFDAVFDYLYPPLWTMDPSSIKFVE